MPDLSDQVAALDRVLELAALINADMRSWLVERGLTESRTRLLWELRRWGQSTQRELADALGVSPRNITGLVDALVATGFVSREPHPSDRRATLVSFTEHGGDLARSLGEGQRDFAAILFTDMPEAAFAGFVEGLDAVLDRLRQHVPLHDLAVDDA